MGVQREDRREEEREKEREENYLNLTTFHQCAVELFPGFLCVCAVLKCHKAKTLWYTAGVKELAVSEGHIIRDCGKRERERIICESLDLGVHSLTLFNR